MNLFNITQEQRSLISLLEENGGEVNDEILEDLAIRRENFEHKAEAYAYIILKMEAEAEMADTEMKRIQAIKKTKENIAKRLKETLRDALMVFGNEDPKSGIKRYETPLFKIATRRSESVNIVDESLIPESYWAIKREVSKSSISSAMKAGEEVAGAEMKVNYSVQIR
jgi:uncharacterized protein YrzB (UPF0473 family)